MLANSGLTTAEMLEVFDDEILARGGRVSDCHNDGRRLLVRSILPRIEKVRPGDGLQGGVALKATAGEVCLYPYVFRLVCSNGAIIACTVGEWSVADPGLQEPEAVLQSIREGVRMCSAEDVFMENVDRIRSASQQQIDLALNLLPVHSRLSALNARQLFSQILERFFLERESTQFGLANAVTALARDTTDPELRWNLEELGGEIAIGSLARQSVEDGRGTRARRLAPVVG